MPTATATETVTFIARCPNLVLTRRQAHYVPNGMGGMMFQGEQEWLEAQRRKNEERELAGLQPLDVDELPWKIEFTNSVFSSDDERLVEFLRSHRLCNTPKGFYEQGAAPDEPRPTSTEQHTRIAEASARADYAGLEEALEIEKDTHNRAPIIQAAETALRALWEIDSGVGGDAGQSGDPSSTSNSSPAG